MYSPKGSNRSQAPGCNGPSIRARSDSTSPLLRVLSMESIFPEKQVPPDGTLCFSSTIPVIPFWLSPRPCWYYHLCEWISIRTPILCSDPICETFLESWTHPERGQRIRFFCVFAARVSTPYRLTRLSLALTRNDFYCFISHGVLYSSLVCLS